MTTAPKKKDSLQYINLPKNIKLLMNHYNLTVSNLAKETGIPYTTLSSLINDKNPDPRIKTLNPILEYFEISLDELLCDDMSINGSNTNKSICSAPIINWELCLKGSNYINNLKPAEWDSWVAIEARNDHTYYALHTKSSMSPRFPKGTLIIIDTNVKVVDGDLIIAHYPNTNEATLREIQIDGPNKLLISVNKDCVQDILTNDIHILGVVIQSRFNYGI